MNCPKCGSSNVSVARDMKSTRLCGECQHEWLPQDEADKEATVLGGKLSAALMAIADLTVDLEFSRRELQAFKSMMTTANVQFVVTQQELDHIMPSDAERFVKERLIKQLANYVVEEKFVKITETPCVEGRQYQATLVLFK